MHRSEVPGADSWSPKNHVGHLIRIERSFLTFARRTVAGDVEPIGFSQMGTNQDEVRAAIRMANQRQPAATSACPGHHGSVHTDGLNRRGGTVSGAPVAGAASRGDR